MSNLQRGNNAGLSGLFDLPAASTAPFKIKIYRWSARTDGSTKPRLGRGSGEFPDVRWLFAGGQIAFTGALPPSGCPAPNQWRGERGTITIQMMQGATQAKTVAYPVVITNHGFEFDEKKNDFPVISGTAAVLGQPAYTGWGTQVASVEATKADQQQYGGTTQTLDPSDLQSGAVTIIDWWGDLADTDSAEAAKLAEAIGAALAPFPNVKIRSASIARDAIDGGTITITWARTTTAEDAINQATEQKIDPNKIETGGTVSAINSTPSVPSVAGQTTVERTVTTHRLNDGNVLFTVEYGQRSTIDDIQMEGTIEKIDKSGIESEGQNTTVFAANTSPPADASPPDSTLKVIATGIQQINLDQSKKTTYFDVNSAAEKVLFARAKSDTDPSGIRSSVIKGAVFVTSNGTPATPTVSGLVLRDTLVVPLTSPDTSNLSAVFWEFGETTSADEAIFEHQRTITDPEGLTSATVEGAIFVNGSPPSTPSAPSGLKIKDYTDIPLTDAGASNLSIRVWQFATRDSKDAIQMDGTETKVGVGGIDSTAQATQVYVTTSGAPSVPSAPDASLQIVATEQQQLDINRSKQVTYFDVNTPAEKLLFAREKTVSDPALIDSLTIKGAIYTTGSPPSAPGASGLVLISTDDYPVTSPNTSNLSMRIWTYGETTSADRIIFDQERTETDPNDIQSVQLIAELYTNGSPPPDPSTPSGLKLVSKIDKPITNASASDQVLRVWKFAKLDSLDEIILPKLKTTIDANNINCTAVRLKSYLTTDSVPSSPDSVPSNNVKVLYTEDLTITPVNGGVAGRMVRIWYYGPKDSKDEKILDKYSTTTDASTLALQSRAFKSYLDGDTLDSTITDSNGNTLHPVNTTVVPVSLGLGTNRTLYVLEFGLATAQQAKEAQELKTSIDGSYSQPLYLDDKAVITKLWIASGSAPSDPTAPINTKLLGVTDAGVPENPLLLQRVWVFGAQSSADKLVLGSVWPRHRYETVTDSSNLQSSAFRACLIPTADGSLSASTNPSTVADANSNTLYATKTYAHPQSFNLPIHNATLYITEYAMSTLAQAEAFEASEATADPLDIYRRIDASIVTVGSGTSTDALADSVLGANKTDYTFDAVTIKRRTPTQALQILRYTGEDMKRHSATVHTLKDNFRGKPGAGWNNSAAFNDPNAYILVQAPGSVVGGPGGFTYGIIQPTYWQRNLGEFRVRRRFITTTARRPEDFYWLSVRGKVNSGSFLGYPAYQVMYVGPEPIYNGYYNDNHLVVVDLVFRTDDLMFMNDGNLPGLGKAYVYNLSTLITGTQYYSYTLFAPSGGAIGMQWPGSWDFSTFGIV